MQLAVIPSPADASALPINRIQAVAGRESENILLADSTFAVDPLATEWEIRFNVSLFQSPSNAVVSLYLINQDDGGAQEVQFSGRSPSLTLANGDTTIAPDVPLVRGPLGNVFATGVSAALATDTVVEGTTLALTADVTSSSQSPTRVFWTSLDPTIVTVDSATAFGVVPGTANVVASVGAFADTVTLTVVRPSVASVQVIPDSADISIGGTKTYAAELRDADSQVLTGRTVTWSTGDPAIATVDAQTGVVTGVSVGMTEVTSTSEGLSGSAVVVVRAPNFNGWTNPEGGTWNDPANWFKGAAPAAGDSVVIVTSGATTITLDVDPTVASLTIGGIAGALRLEADGRTINVTGPIEVRSTGTLSLTSSTLNAPTLVNSGTL